jgi:hypothetical protein
MAKNGLAAIHPGEFLAEILGEMKLSEAEFGVCSTSYRNTGSIFRRLMT